MASFGKQSALRNQAVTGVKWNAIERLSSRLVQFTTTIVLVRLLVPQEYGVFSLALVILSFMQEFNDGGMATAIVRDNTIPPRVLNALFWLNMVIGVVAAATLFLIAHPIASGYHLPALAPVLRWLSLALLLSSPGDFIYWILRRDLKFNRVAKIEIPASVMWMLGSVGAAYLGAGASALIYGYLLRTVMRSTLYITLSFSERKLASLPPTLRALRGERFLLRFSFFQVLDRVIYFLSSNVDFAVIGWLLGVEQLAYYTVAYNLAFGIIRIVNSIFQNVALPMLGQVKDNEASLIKAYYQLIRLLAVIVVPLLLMCAVGAFPMVRILYGVRWTPSVVVLEYLGIYGLFYSYRSVTFDMLKVKGRADISMWYNLGTLAFMAIVDWIGARAGGIKGVAEAAVVASAVLLVIDIRLGKSQYALSVFKLVHTLRPAIKGGAVMSTILWALLHFGSASHTILVLTDFVLAWAGYFACIWHFEREFSLEAIELLKGTRKKNEKLVSI